MEINICHLYPDLLNVYGDVGNILILKHRAEKRGIKVNIVNDGKDLILNNLHYTYSAGNSTNIFNFNTSSPLSVDSDNRTFSGIFLVDAIFNSIPSHFTQRVIISHNY